jgi:hypothetical protein
MSPRTVSEVLAVAAAEVVSPHHDLTGALATLLSGAVDALPADAAAVLVRSPGGDLEVLASTSHRTADLEMYQVQVDEGPCVDALRGGVAVDALGHEDIVARWPLAGPAVVASGYATVHATPLRWRGETFGALNVFRVAASDLGMAGAAASRALADAATVLLVTHGRFDPDHLALSLDEALEARAVVEQAKGALAHARGLDMASAFDALLELAAQEDVGLGEVSQRVMARARARTLR